MKTSTVRAGVTGGVLGGMVMAFWSMTVLWYTGAGFWMPLNLIAHTFWRWAPLNGTFSPAALGGSGVTNGETRRSRTCDHGT